MIALEVEQAHGASHNHTLIAGATQRIAVTDYPYANWRQDDARLNRLEAWPSSLFPDAEYHYFGGCGCLVCALAVMLRHCGAESEEDEALFNPWVLNERLIDCGAFSPAADLELADVGHLYPLEYMGAIPYSRDALDELAGNRSPCLVTVPGEKAARHFTALLSVLEDDAVVYDPRCGCTRLSSYDRLLEIRAFRFGREGRGDA